MVDPRLDNLWSEQADALRAYAPNHVATADVALELPTGSGKTLVGLLIAEWRRLKLGERVALTSCRGLICGPCATRESTPRTPG